MKQNGLKHTQSTLVYRREEMCGVPRAIQKLPVPNALGANRTRNGDGFL
jgi:hypothetical protein